MGRRGARQITRERRGCISKLLRDLLKRVALDDIVRQIFGKITQLDATLQPRTDLFDVVLETSQRTDTAVVNRLLFRSTRARALRLIRPSLT